MRSFGTTSACAENTFPFKVKTNILWNYLRVRGEYWVVATPLLLQLELPPRARRIRLYYWGDDQDEGTTSACAENTSVGHMPKNYMRNYLRVRGEYMLVALVN